MRRSILDHRLAEKTEQTKAAAVGRRDRAAHQQGFGLRLAGRELDEPVPKQGAVVFSLHHLR